MTSFELLKLLGNAQDEYIMDSRKRPKQPQKPPILKIAALAACAAILIGLGGTMLYLKPWTSGSSAPTNAPETLSSPAPGGENGSTAEDVPKTSVNPLESDGITLLSAAQSPAMPKTAEERSKAWQENQVSEDTDYALSAFAYQLGSKVLSGTEDSVCFSPVSLYQVLSVITSGAGGTTQEQLLSLLGQGDVDTLKSEMQKLYQVNQQDTETDHLEFAGSLWLDEKQQDGENQVGFHPDWVMQAAMDYYCDVYAADFSSGAANAPLAAWINQHTGGLMADRLEDFSMSPNTVMAAVNTVYYHSQWVEQFKNTAQGTFTAQDGTQTTCDFMQRTEMGGEAVVTERYTKSYLQLSSGQMYVVLPKDGVDLDELLSEDTLWEIFEDSSYEAAQVEWSVPKFTTDTDLDLKDALTAAGVTDAFHGDAANFSAIADTPLYLSSVIQGTHIAVNEDGIEAAAYSIAGMEAGAADPDEAPVVEMNLNRPFLYLITASDGSPLFFGVVRDVE